MTLVRHPPLSTLVSCLLHLRAHNPNPSALEQRREPKSATYAMGSWGRHPEYLKTGFQDSYTQP